MDRAQEVFKAFVAAAQGYDRVEVGCGLLLLEGYLIKQFPEHASALREFVSDLEPARAN